MLGTCKAAAEPTLQPQVELGWIAAPLNFMDFWPVLAKGGDSSFEVLFGMWCSCFWAPPHLQHQPFMSSGEKLAPGECHRGGLRAGPGGLAWRGGCRSSWEDPAGFESDAGRGAAERRRKMRVCLLFHVLSNFRNSHFSFHFGFKKQKPPTFWEVQSIGIAWAKGTLL